MADSENTTTEAHERPGVIVETLREAGVDRELTRCGFSTASKPNAPRPSRRRRAFYTISTKAT